MLDLRQLLFLFAACVLVDSATSPSFLAGDVVELLCRVRFDGQVFDWASLDTAHQPRFRYPKTFALPTPALRATLNQTAEPRELKWQFALARGTLQTPWLYVTKKQYDSFNTLAELRLAFEFAQDRIVDLDWDLKYVQSREAYVGEIMVQFEWKSHGKGEDVELGMSFLLSGIFLTVVALFSLVIVDLIQRSASGASSDDQRPAKGGQGPTAQTYAGAGWTAKSE